MQLTVVEEANTRGRKLRDVEAFPVAESLQIDQIARTFTALSGDRVQLLRDL